MSESQPADSITTDAGKAGPDSTRMRVKRIGGYVYALALPWLAAYLSFHAPALRGMRLALNFSAIAAAATFFGPGSAAVALAVSIISFEYYLPTAPNPELAGMDRSIRTAVLVLAGGLIALMIRQRLMAERELRIALARLREQAEALIQAQQASRSAAWTFDAKTLHTGGSRAARRSLGDSMRRSSRWARPPA
jgi:hypothetical protein